MIDAKTAVLAKDFVASNTQGRPVHLSGYRAKKHVVLVFNRGLG
jgi:peroxiredoxin